MLTLVNPGLTLNMSFVQQTITKMANKMVAAYQFASIRCCGHSNLSFLISFLPNFIYGLLPSNPGSSLNMSFVVETIIKMADKMATAYQFEPICCCGHSNLVIFLRISSDFHIWIASITLWFKFEYEFCPNINGKDG